MTNSTAEQPTKARRTYKYRLYRCDKRDKHLHHAIDIAASVWNHALALQKRYYALTGKYIGMSEMKQHIAYLRMHTTQYAWWKDLGAQAVQDVIERQDKAYRRFFKWFKTHDGPRMAPPKFKARRKYKSFTLKQNGWALSNNLLYVLGHNYKLVLHRPVIGTIKTVTIKRDTLNRLWVCFSVVDETEYPSEAATGKRAGFDFGLKTFLTDSDNTTYISPQFFKQDLSRIRKLQSRKDKKPRSSKNRKSAARHIARVHIRIADKRRDYHFKLANALCDTFDVMYFEDLNIAGMQRLWGRKVSDLGFAQFLAILEVVAAKRGRVVAKIGRWERTTGKCSACGHKQDMELRERTFYCEQCGLVIDRDYNAARNIYQAGASAYTRVEGVRLVSASNPC